MGNTSSSSANAAPLSSVMTEASHAQDDFYCVVDYIASYYILTSDFKTLSSLGEKAYCDKLVILTADILDRHFDTRNVEFLKRRVEGGDELTREKMFFLPAASFDRVERASVEKKRACIGIAKFYVRIAHLFAAILMTLNPMYSFIDPTTGEKRRVGLMEKSQIPEGAEKRLYKYGICNTRIAALKRGMDPALGALHPQICSMNRGRETLADEPGIPELQLLYYDDQYDYETGEFMDMSPETAEQYRRDLELFYRAFTGQETMPSNIRKFSDIHLRDYGTKMACARGLLSERMEIGATHEMFVQYANHLRSMIIRATQLQQQLLDVIDRLFVFVPTADVGGLDDSFPPPTSTTTPTPQASLLPAAAAMPDTLQEWMAPRTPLHISLGAPSPLFTSVSAPPPPKTVSRPPPNPPKSTLEAIGDTIGNLFSSTPTQNISAIPQSLLREMPDISQPLPREMPAMTQPLPREMPAMTQPLPGEMPAMTQPLPREMPAMTQPLPGEMPAMTQPLPREMPAMTQPLPNERPIQAMREIKPHTPPASDFPIQKKGEKGVQKPSMMSSMFESFSNLLNMGKKNEPPPPQRGGGFAHDIREIPHQKIRIHPDMTSELLQKEIDVARNIIVQMYLQCENDYVEGVRLYEAIVEKKIFETTQRQLASLEREAGHIMSEAEQTFTVPPTELPTPAMAAASISAPEVPRISMAPIPVRVQPWSELPRTETIPFTYLNVMPTPQTVPREAPPMLTQKIIV